MHHHFFIYQSSYGSGWIDTLIPLLSVIVAGFSAYYAFRAMRQSRESQIPMLVPIITDVSDAQTLNFDIENIGNGVAKNIKVEIRPTGRFIPFNSDLLPRKFSDSIQHLGNWTTIPFSDGDNPLFENGELFITYQDIWGKEYWMKATFKRDAVPARSAKGHIDKQFAGIFYGPI
jgi:hypothetical protein